MCSGYKNKEHCAVSINEVEDRSVRIGFKKSEINGKRMSQRDHD